MPFTKTKKVGEVYRKTGEIRKKQTDWGAILLWGFVGLMILGALEN